MKTIVNTRDFLYLVLLERRGEVYANSQHKFLLRVILSPYYISLIAVIGILQYKFGIPPFFQKSNIIGELIDGLILFTPYIVIMKQIEKKMEHLPLPNKYGDEKKSHLKKTAYKTIIIGFLLLFLLPPVVDYIIPLN